MNEGFAAAVLAWLRTIDENATTVVEVTPYGTEWYGSTEEGFSDHFDVDITYVSGGGVRRHQHVTGPELADLWKAVMA